jgi:hypothetical protein
MDRVAPGARLEEQITELLSNGLGDDGEHLAELGRLGARLVLQRAVEDEVTALLNRARYERTTGAKGSRNGTRPKAIQTAEGEISIAMPQVRATVEQFVSKVIPDTRAVVDLAPSGVDFVPRSHSGNCWHLKVELAGRRSGAAYRPNIEPTPALRHRFGPPGVTISCAAAPSSPPQQALYVAGDPITE